VKVAIVGSGIAGLTCAHRLRRHHDVTVFEADQHAGGHAHTVRVEVGADEAHDVDTGFIVYNEANYPHFTELLHELDVETQPSTMSFSVSDPDIGLEYCGNNLNRIYAQRTNIGRPWFARMLVDILRFDRRARRLLAEDGGPRAADDGWSGPVDELTLAALVAAEGYSPAFVDDFLIPLGASIWSADPETFLEFPAVAYARFMDNHGLLSLRRGPQWRSITGGSQRYVEAIVAPLGDRLRLDTPVTKIRRTGASGRIEVLSERHGLESFDRVILAGHSDQSLELLADPTEREREILGAIRYQPNIATLHTDARFLPTVARARASWNYHVGSGARSRSGGPGVALTYWMNLLQSIESTRPLLITLNRHDEIDPDQVLGRFDYDHPVFDLPAMRAQRHLAEIQGVDGTYYAGAYWGYGFHEDGVRSALDVCRHFGVGT
jgi:uncharacterized protein